MVNYSRKKISSYDLPVSQGASVTDGPTGRQTTDDNHINSSTVT